MTMQVMVSNETSIVIAIRGSRDVKLFQEFCNRAIGTWDQAAPQLKELADLVTEQTVRQDYYAQAQTTREKEEAKND